MEAANLLHTPYFVKLQTMTNAEIPSSQVKTHWICINLRNDLWQKWGGHVQPMATPLHIHLPMRLQQKHKQAEVDYRPEKCR